MDIETAFFWVDLIFLIVDVLFLAVEIIFIIVMFKEIHLLKAEQTQLKVLLPITRKQKKTIINNMKKNKTKSRNK